MSAEPARSAVGLVARGTVAGALGGVVNAAIALASWPLVVVFDEGQSMEVGGGLAFVETVIPGLVAGLLFAGLRALLRRPTPAFVALSVVVLVLSFLPLGAAADTSTAVALGAMHVVAAACILVALLRS